MSKDAALFWKYITPSIIGMVIGGSYSIVDTIFIGQGGGKVALAAAAITWPLVMFLHAFGCLIGGGGAVLISQSRGAGSFEQEKCFFSQTIFCVMAGSLLLTAGAFPLLEGALLLLGTTEELMPISLRYAQILTGCVGFGAFMTTVLEVVRNDGRPALSMGIMAAGLLLNVGLDALFVVYLKMGAVGAAAATAVSQGVTCLLGVAYFLSPLTKLHFTREIFIPQWKKIKEIVITGLPIYGNMLSIIAMLYMHNAQSLRYGKVDGLAAYTVISSLEALGSMLMTGVAAGIQPLTAMMYGAGKHKRQNRFGNYGYWFSFALGIVLMLFSLAMHKVMPFWMGLKEGNAFLLAMQGIMLSAPSFLFLGVIRVAAFYYQSTGNIVKSSWLIYGDAFLALPLCIYTLPVWFGMTGVWLAMPVSRILLMLLLCYFWFGNKFKNKMM